MPIFPAVVIFVFASVQSVLGVGLLVFGTPTLLLMDYSFAAVLGILLPASITISFLQCLEDKSARKLIQRDFNIYCLPAVALGLFIVLTFDMEIELKNYVGGLLLFSGLIRLHAGMRAFMFNIIGTQKPFYLTSMGLVHGLTNMGGGLLALYSSAIFSDKKSIRGGIAYGYIAMGLAQYCILLFSDPSRLNLFTIASVVLAAAAYFLVGKKLFLLAREGVYQNAVTTLILVYGLLLLLK